jgi:hypothetical protein
MRALFIVGVLPAVTGTAAAQIISIKTVPVTQADAFGLFPSHNFGMGGVSIALADTLLDLSANPATGARLVGGRFFSAPSFYSVSFDAGGGGAVPVGAFTRAGPWFGAVSLAAQMVGPSRPGTPILAVPAGIEGFTARTVSVEPNRSRGNAFAFALLGKEWRDAGLSVGASAFWSRRSAIDGVDLFYAGSQNVRQFGHSTDLRLGLLKLWPGTQSLEAVLLYNGLRMQHDVTFVDAFWDPASQQIMLRQRLEANFDHTDIWGMHLEYDRPLSVSAPGWRIGWVATLNRMFHPELPNYDVRDAGIRAVPWDPGDSHAYSFGVGVSRVYGPARFGLDALYEPIWSYTWGKAPSPLVTRLGDTIPAGGKTVENHFEFSNVLFRMGVGRDFDLGSSHDNVAGVQVGLVARFIHYWLAQFDNVQAAGRNLEEQWMEWTPTWGFSFRFPELQLRYNGSVTKGTGRPGVSPTCSDCVFAERADAVAAAAPILATRSGPLNLTNVNVFSHQISVSFPLGQPLRRGAP